MKGPHQGAFDLLQKPFRDHELLARVQRALAKDRAICEQMDSGDAAAQRRLGSLTAREHDVLDLVTAGTPPTASQTIEGSIHPYVHIRIANATARKHDRPRVRPVVEKTGD